MTEADWHRSLDLDGMLACAVRRADGRRFQACALFWVDRVAHLLDDGQRARVAGYVAAHSARPPTHSGYIRSIYFKSTYADDYATGNAAHALSALLADDWLTAVLLAGRAFAQDLVYGPSVSPHPSAHELRVRYIPVADRV